MEKKQAILRFEKRKKGSVAKIGNHHERTKESYKSNPDIQREKSGLNYHIKRPQDTYTREVASRIAQAGCRTRKDSVLLADTFIGGSHGYMLNLSKQEQKEFFERAYHFLAERVGENNIISAVVHMDERTPHMHLVFTPITGNRLSAKEVLGNPDKFRKWQDDFYACMVERFTDLERGQPASETGRKHIPVRLYKQAGRLNGQIEEIRQVLADVNMLNATKKRKEVLSMLQKWYPLANGFNEQVKRIVSDSKVLKEQNVELVQKLKSEQGNFSQEISEKDKEITDLMTEYTDLITSYNNNIRLLQQLAPEEVRILQERLQGQQSRMQEPQDLEDYKEQY